MADPVSSAPDHIVAAVGPVCHQITPIPSSENTAVETPDGTFLISPDGSVIEELVVPCPGCGDPDCDFDCDGTVADYFDGDDEEDELE